MTLLAKRYATALHLAARKANAQEQVAADVQAVHQDLLSPAARALLLSPDISVVEREHLLGKLGKGRHALVQNLLFVLLRRHRLDLLFDLHPAFRLLMLQERGEIEGVVETPRPFAADEAERLHALAQKLAGRKVQLAVKVRPELIGGVRLFLGNVLYDGSVKSALDQMEQALRSVPV